MVMSSRITLSRWALRALIIWSMYSTAASPRLNRQVRVWGACTTTPPDPRDDLARAATKPKGAGDGDGARA